MFNEKDLIPQLEAMRSGVNYRQEITLRGFKMMVRPLTVTETLRVTANVNEMLGKLPENARNRVQENILLAKETLKISSTSDIDAGDGTITDYIMDRMTAEEIQFMFRQYVSVMDKVNPVLDKLPPEEVQLLAEQIKKNPSELTERSFLEVVNVCLHLIQSE